jgi:hypothetical protein
LRQRNQGVARRRTPVRRTIPQDSGKGPFSDENRLRRKSGEASCIASRFSFEERLNLIKNKEAKTRRGLSLSQILELAGHAKNHPIKAPS